MSTHDGTDPHDKPWTHMTPDTPKDALETAVTAFIRRNCDEKELWLLELCFRTGWHAHESATAAQAQDGVSLIAQERARQIAQEGWTPEHDDEHQNGEMAKAAACYADFGCPTEEREVFVQLAKGLADPESYVPVRASVPVNWPWAPEWWRPVPNNRVRELTKAGALIAAEIDRLNRLPSPTLPDGKEGA